MNWVKVIYEHEGGELIAREHGHIRHQSAHENSATTTQAINDNIEEATTQQNATHEDAEERLNRDEREENREPEELVAPDQQDHFNVTNRYEELKQAYGTSPSLCGRVARYERGGMWQ